MNALMSSRSNLTDRPTQTLGISPLLASDQSVRSQIERALAASDDVSNSFGGTRNLVGKEAKESARTTTVEPTHVRLPP